MDDVNNFAARSVYIFSNGNTLNEALTNNNLVSKKLDSLKQLGFIKKYSSINSLCISTTEQQTRINRWNSFFTASKKDSIKQHLISAGLAYKFKATAFQSFYNLLESPVNPLSKADSDTLNKLLFKEWIGNVDGKPSIINHIKVDAENRKKNLQCL